MTYTYTWSVNHNGSTVSFASLTDAKAFVDANQLSLQTLQHKAVAHVTSEDFQPVERTNTLSWRDVDVASK